jgi:DNA-binding transcriptional LysR family regulator
MLNKRHNSVVTLAILLTLVGVSKPAKADLVAQAGAAPATFTAPDKLPKDSTVKIGASNSTNSIGTSLQESFLSRYPQARVTIETQDSSAALKSLAEGKVDLAAIGRALTEAEKAQGFVSVPISREKIAIVVSKDNPFAGNLTIDQFAKIFRGEITNWSEIGGAPGKIKLVDYPNSNDIRQSLPNYAVFQSAEFKTGSTASQIKQDDIGAMITQLGTNGISYAVANDVMNRDDVKVVTMHSTLPDDPRYPFSEPFSLIYQGTPNKAAQAYIGYVTTEGGKKVVATRVGSISTAAVTAIASGVGANLANPKGAATEPAAGTKTPGTVAKKGTNAIADGKNAVSTTAKQGTAAIADGKDTVSTTAKQGTDAIADGKDAISTTAKQGTDAIADGKDTVSTTAKQGTAAIADGKDTVSTTAKQGTNAIADGKDTVSTTAKQGTNAIADGKDTKSIGDAAKTQAGGIGTDKNAIANGDVNSQAQPNVNADVQGSGEVNPNVNGSGEVNPDIQGSGEVNPNVNGSGEVNPGVKGSGEVNPDVNGSGEVNPDVQGSGEPLSSTNGNADGANTKDTAVAPTGTADADSGAKVAAKKGQWWKWWWLLPLLGIPLIAAAILGGRKKSDQEPALNDISNINNLNNGSGIPGGSGGGDIPPVGVNTSGGLGNVAESTANTSSDLGTAGLAAGGAALAGGAATAANLAGRRNRKENAAAADVDLDLDLDLDEPTTVEEIPSNPVTEFTTGQATKLQFDGQSEGQTTKLQFDEQDEDLGGDGNFDLDTKNKTEINSDQENINVEDIRLDDNVDQFTTEQTTDVAGINPETSTETNFVEEVETDGVAGNGNVGREFTGDFVLEEENKVDLSTDVDFNQDPNAQGTDGIDGMTQAGGAAIAGGAAALGGAAAAASGFFNRGDGTTEEANIDARTEVADSEQSTDLNIDSDTEPNITERVGEEINNVSSNFTENTSNLTEDFTTPEFDPNRDLNLDSNQDPNAQGTGIIDGVTQAGGAAIAGGAAALGGAAAAASGFFNRGDGTTEEANIDARTEVADSEQSTDLNIDLDTEPNLAAQAGEGINSVSPNVPENISNLTGDFTTTELDPNRDINLDPNQDSNAEGTSIIDGVTQAGGATALGGAAAAETGFFNRDSQETANIQEFEAFETSLDAIDDSSSPTRLADNVTADAETFSLSLDDEDDAINASLEEITFDDATPTGEISLDNFTFEDTDSTINASLEEITLEDATLRAEDQDINLDDQDINLDDLGFEEITNSSDEPSGDLNNISEWLDSLETPNQDRDNIADWLDTLDKESIQPKSDATSENINQETTDGLAENDDISFQFLEDLLDRDTKNNPNNQ